MLVVGVVRVFLSICHACVVVMVVILPDCEDRPYPGVGGFYAIDN